MDSHKGLTYRDAGVDIDAQDRALRRIAELLRSTTTPGVLSELGTFGGMFALPSGAWREPVLVASVDGVGTKMKVAAKAGRYDTVGRDLVNHCVNDIFVQGARPLFFLDYVAAEKLDPPVVVELVEGVARGCREHECALIGGETAEMPGVYREGEYDLAGTIVGIVERDRMIGGRGGPASRRVAAGDVLVGLSSAGLHTNGYSLARKIFFDRLGLDTAGYVPELNATLGDALLAEHRSYYHLLAGPVEAGWVRGMAHITGGGITDNLPRILPEGVAARVGRGSWPVPAIFRLIEREGTVAEEEMYRTFNMGLGMIVAAGPEAASRIEKHLSSRGEISYRIGEIVPGPRRVEYV